MADLGAPIAYTALAEGTPVYGSGGEELGTVAHVLAAEDEDIFDGIVLRHGLGGHRFADASQVAAIHECGVRLTVADADELPEPSENPAVLEADPAAPADDGGTSKLRRAWDLISGNY